MHPPRRFNARRRLLLAAPALAAAALLAPSAASAQPVKVGNVYTQTNDTSNNQVIAFTRFSDGTITESQRVDTGGTGEFSTACPPNPPTTPCPVTDSQGSVALTPAGTLLFVTNAGSDTISSFRVSPTRGLTLVDQVPSGGDYPMSLTIHGNLLYVVNQDSGNIAGFRFTSAGLMTPIPGSIQDLATPGPGGVAAQIGFDKAGRNLVVTERGTNLIDNFRVTNGVAGPVTSQSTPPDATTPFGFAFDSIGHLVVSDALSESSGATTTYGQSLNGPFTPIDTESTGGGAPCWVVITPDNRFAYVSNTTTASVAEYRLGVHGSLTLLGDVPMNTPDGQFPTDEALSRDGRFLYVINPSVFVGDESLIEVFKVGLDGKLTFLSETPATLPIGISGLAAN